MNEKWFSMPIDEVEKKLKTNAASGLNLKAAKARKSKDEPFFPSKKKKHRIADSRSFRGFLFAFAYPGIILRALF